MNDERALQNLGSQELSAMRPEFQAGMSALLDRVYAKVQLLVEKAFHPLYKLPL
jgi:hypothetical protein